MPGLPIPRAKTSGPAVASTHPKTAPRRPVRPDSDRIRSRATSLSTAAAGKQGALRRPVPASSDAPCTANGPPAAPPVTLRFHDELIGMDREPGDYVIVHEFLLFSVPNHGKLWKALLRALGRLGTISLPSGAFLSSFSFPPNPESGTIPTPKTIFQKSRDSSCGREMTFHCRPSFLPGDYPTGA